MAAPRPTQRSGGQAAPHSEQRWLPPGTPSANAVRRAAPSCLPACQPQACAPRPGLPQQQHRHQRCSSMTRNRRYINGNGRPCCYLPGPPPPPPLAAGAPAHTAPPPTHLCQRLGDAGQVPQLRIRQLYRAAAAGVQLGPHRPPVRPQLLKGAPAPQPFVFINSQAAAAAPPPPPHLGAEGRALPPAGGPG